jgi:mono/diheme cytochrome c family protein
MKSRNTFVLSGIIILVVVTIFYSLAKSEKQIDYSADVKPIFNKKCIACHGGVKKQSGFSLLFQDEAMARAKSGKFAIVPGDPDGSELMRRITCTDPDERMPYKKEPLTSEEISTLRTWIKQGAKWGDHWAYLPVKKTEVPEVSNNWVRNDIDKFIYSKLDEMKFKPSPVADRATLLRRVSLDLIGVPASQQAASRFINGKNFESDYKLLVDSLLASKRFGERWASTWLDVARYADTKGYEADFYRNIWQYRDWVINAFNQDKPYDTFITEQIAGDLLPNPTDEQFIATAFQRNSPTNDEGGTNNEEFRTAAVLDRVNTTWSGLMSTTFACVQCHSHPYDPFKHDEFYKFMAYFNNTRDEDIPNDYPLFRSYDNGLKTRINTLNTWLTANYPQRAKPIMLFLKTGQPAINSPTADDLDNAYTINNNGYLVMQKNGIARLAKVDMEHADELILTCNSGGVNGGVLQIVDSKRNGAIIATCKLPQTPRGDTTLSIKFAPQQGAKDIYLVYHNPSLKDKENGVRFNWFYFTQQFPGKGTPGYAQYQKTYWDAITSRPQTTPVMVENPASMSRKSYVFERGAWTSHGKEVQPGVPQSLAYAMPANAPQNRLGLAMWLTSKKNPLVSRTMVNRLWEQLFGTGIVETLEDMGTQGISPTHKELLDYLSYQFMNDYKWSVKKLLREFVTSATYMQDSKVHDDLKEKDPNNLYYARGPRIRLSAEQVRDQALAASGIISYKMFGAAVMPWQPAGIWSSPYNGATWKTSNYGDAYRRAIYTYWKRTAPYPSMITFDGTPRIVCTSRRIRTNTPLQALVTLNDSVYVDLARHFAERMTLEGGTSAVSQIKKGYELLMYKPIASNKLQALSNLYSEALKEYTMQPNAAAKLLATDASVKPQKAALVIVANAMLNLDEIITKN